MSIYQILPFRFKRFDDKNILLANEAGEFLFLSIEEFKDMISYKLHTKSTTFLDLKSKHFRSVPELLQGVLDIGVKKA